MSELINNAEKRRALLKHMIKQLHEGQAPEAVKAQLIQLLGKVPYEDVVLVEQELISEGMPPGEILKLCDIHTKALEGAISQEGSKEAPPGHPVHTFLQENRGLGWHLNELKKSFSKIEKMDDDEDASAEMAEVRNHIHALTDVDKHYKRKENLLFPYLEKHGITGPPTVMWGKHDEARELLNSAVEALAATQEYSAGEAESVIELALKPAAEAIEEMIYKEEEILFPMSMDTLEDSEWFDIYNQSLEIGYCLYDPKDEWRPQDIDIPEKEVRDGERIQLPSGSFTKDEINTILNTIPFDLTFVDKDDTVRYFTQGKERIFERSRAILGRQVQLCHPPKSVHIVEKILEDFKSGKHDRAAFWIEMKGRFISIEYYALRSREGEYQGVLEVSQDLTEKRQLEGEQRLLNYAE
ncbi:MAG TPA: DUF438 domain-containing protein [candidate division Zixibacteria bacterium]|nr:DUF438 domain-containing protein [candidate division Zixibacteria bacterium]